MSKALDYIANGGDEVDRAEAEAEYSAGKIDTAPPFMEWISARGVIEDVEQERDTLPIGAGGKIVIGRFQATKIMNALTKAGFVVRYVGNR